MSTLTNNIRPLLFEKLPKVKGYLDTLDAYIFSGLSNVHATNQSPGSVVEIGVFFGRSLFFLKELYPNNDILGIDLYDIGASNEHKAQIEQILEYNQRFGFGIDQDSLLPADSTQLSAEDIKSRIGEVKLFHIDGGHELNHVINDADLAVDVLSNDGVIVFDDSFNPAWPDVTSGIVHFLNKRPEFQTICISDKKLYVCKSDRIEMFRSEIDKLTQTFDSHSGTFMGHKTLILTHAIKKKAISRGLTKIGLGKFSYRLYS